MHSIFGCVDLLLGKEKPEVPVLWGFGLVGEVFLLWQAAKPSGLKCTNVLYGVEMVRC